MSGHYYHINRLTRRRADGSTYWNYCIKWSDERGTHRVSLGTADRAAAETRARELWQRRTLGQADTVGQIVEAYLASLGGTRDEQRKRDGWRAARGYWADLRPTSIDEHTSRAYLDWRGRAINTMRNELATIRTALHWALKAAAPKIVVPAMPESVVEHLSKAEFRRFLAGCSAPHVALFAQLAVTTGARATALLELPWVRVDLDRRLINLRRRASESADQRPVSLKSRAIVPINGRLYPLLVEARAAAQTPFVIEVAGARISSIKKGIAAAAARSGVHCTPHMFRHSAAVWMAESRVPMQEISRYLGHRDTRTTERVYARFHPDYLQQAAQALDW